MRRRSRRTKDWQVALKEHGFDPGPMDGILGVRTAYAIAKCKDWQRWLNEHGFNCGVVDGWPGPKFEAALKAFQKAAGCHHIDGIVGSETENAKRHCASKLRQVVRKVVIEPSNQILRRRWQAMVVHYSFSDFGNVAVIDKWHRARGWWGCGYHFVVTNGNGGADGEVQASPRWEKQRAGAHCPGWNSKAIGICYIGTKYPTELQYKSMIDLVKMLMFEHQIPKERIFGHKELEPTACPGELEMEIFRNKL